MTTPEVRGPSMGPEPTMTMWHGGPPVAGDRLLPPSLTGFARVCHGDDWVYVTPVRGLALMYACSADNGWLYEVEPVGETVQDPDSFLPAGQSLRCREARIVRRFRPSRHERQQAQFVLGSIAGSLEEAR